MRRGATMSRAVIAALLLAGCVEDRPLPPPVTGDRILDVPGIQAVVSAVALSADGSLVAVGDTDGELVGGKAYPVFRGDAPFYRAMSISVPTSLVALLRPGDEQGRGPYGLEVWRLIYRTP